MFFGGFWKNFRIFYFFDLRQILTILVAPRAGFFHPEADGLQIEKNRPEVPGAAPGPEKSLKKCKQSSTFCTGHNKRSSGLEFWRPRRQNVRTVQHFFRFFGGFWPNFRHEDFLLLINHSVFEEPPLRRGSKRVARTCPRRSRTCPGRSRTCPGRAEPSGPRCHDCRERQAVRNCSGCPKILCNECPKLGSVQGFLMQLSPAGLIHSPSF